MGSLSGLGEEERAFSVALDDFYYSLYQLNGTLTAIFQGAVSPISEVCDQEGLLDEAATNAIELRKNRCDTRLLQIARKLRKPRSSAERAQLQREEQGLKKAMLHLEQRLASYMHQLDYIHLCIQSACLLLGVDKQRTRNNPALSQQERRHKKIQRRLLTKNLRIYLMHKLDAARNALPASELNEEKFIEPKKMLSIVVGYCQLADSAESRFLLGGEKRSARVVKWLLGQQATPTLTLLSHQEIDALYDLSGVTPEDQLEAVDCHTLHADLAYPLRPTPFLHS